MLNIRVFGKNNVIFEPLQQKPCRTIYRFREKTIFGSETCEIGPKVLEKVFGKYTESTESSKTCLVGPIRVHMGPYGPQPGPGPNPDWAPTRPGVQGPIRGRVRPFEKPY